MRVWVRGARVVANELFHLVWKQPDGKRARPARSVFSNKYASLLDGTEEEVDVLVRRLHLSPKAEFMLRRATRLHSRPA